MRIKTVSVTYERKQNMGDYNSAAIGCTLWADLDPDGGDNEGDVMAALWDMAKANVKAQLLPLVTKQTATVKDIFLGLPVQVQEQVTEKENGNVD